MLCRIFFYEKYKITYSKEQLLSELEKQLENRLIEEGIKSYTIENREITETKDGIKLTALISAEENIAKEEKMLISEQN